jgi:4-diphosphocytidyl-2-C-methyl-D-erythritol kinase
VPTIRAHAKINLGLEILRRRDDGFHEIRSVFARLDLHDTLTFRAAGELGVRWPPGMLTPANDLVRRAASLLRQATGTTLGARITLVKSIPVTGGLGGGSSDAAATLFALNQLWQTGLTLEQLSELGSQLGSDVPFFFTSAPALVSGRGEIVEPIEAQLRSWVVLVSPEWELPEKTARLYGALKPDDFSDGNQTNRIVEAIQSGSLERIDLPNTFERIIDSVFPCWSETRKRLEDAARTRFWLTGAGPGLFALLPTEDAAQQAFSAIQTLAIRARVTRLAAGKLRMDP